MCVMEKGTQMERAVERLRKRRAGKGGVRCNGGGARQLFGVGARRIGWRAPGQKKSRLERTIFGADADGGAGT